MSLRAGTFKAFCAVSVGDQDDPTRHVIRFHHVSTDEVYGDLHGTDDLFTEDTPYSQAPLTLHPKQGQIIWYGLGVELMGCLQL